MEENIPEYQTVKGKKVKNPHDLYFKETLGNVHNARDFLQHYLPHPILQVTNLNTLEPQKDTYVNTALEESQSDLLFKAKIQDETGYFYLLFEHKSYLSKNIVLQLLKYMTEIWNTKANKEDNWKLPVVIPLVIYHGPTKWHHFSSLGKMIVGYDLLPQELQIYVPDFEYVFYDLTAYSDEDMKGSAQLKAYLTICRDILTDDREQFLYSLAKAIEYILEIDDEETQHVYLKLLMRYIFQTGKNLTKKDTEKIVKQIPERSEIVMTLAEIYRNEGLEEGLEKGLEKGRKENAIDVAKKAVLMGLDPADIVNLTGLTKNEVKDLQKETKQ